MERARQSPADIRLALKAAGFSPVACIGKVPVLAEWQNRRDATPGEIAKWPGGNSGVDTRNTPGCDIDVDDAEPAADVEGAARDWFDGRGTIPVRFGRMPRRALLFRTSAPFAKIIAKFVAPNGSKHKIEFLGDGQQVVVDGIHPDTNTRYSWHADLCPWNMKREDLIEIDEAEAHAFLDYAAAMLKEKYGFERASDSNGHDTHSPLRTDHVATDPIEALAALDPADGEQVNATYIRVIPELLQQGEHPDDVLERVVNAAMAAAEREGLAWSRPKEVKRVVATILSQYRNMSILLRDYDPTTGAVPSCLPGDFHEAWLRVLAAGGHPIMHFNRGGFCIKSMQRTFPGSTRQSPQPEPVMEAPPPDAERSKPNRPDKKQPQARGPIRAIPFVAFDEAKLPPREWLYANHYQRGQVTATIGPGGAGKSSVDLVEGLAMATARPLLSEQPNVRCRVWIHNGDDDKAEMDRRIAAVCRHYGIPMSELEGWLFVTTKSDTDIKLGAGNGTLAINRVAVDAIISTILQYQIDVFIAEPLVTLHTVPENDNNKMNQIVHLLSGVADSCDCSIEICHHTRKLLAGTEEYSTDDGRGASAIRDAVRGSRVLNSLSREEAQDAGIEEQERAFYFRVDRGKANYLPPATKATWRKFENVELLNGDQVGVVAPWDFPGQGADTPKKAAADQKAENVFLQLLDKFAARGINVGVSPGPNYAPTRFASEREAKTARLGKAVLKEAMSRLLDGGRIRTEEDPGKRGRHRLVPWQGGA